MTTTESSSIELRDGVAFIAGTQVKVIPFIMNHLAYGWDGPQLHANFPYLRMGQIYAALTYYYDHKSEIDRDIARGEREAEELAAKLEDPAVRAKLQEAKRRASATHP